MKMKKNLLDYDLQLFADDSNDEGNPNDTNNVNDTNDKNDKGNNDDGKKEEEKPNEKTFTQSQVNTMMTKEKKQGRNSILKELGINPNDEKAIENVKNLIASQKSEEQIRLEKENESNNLMKEMEQRVALAEAKAEAMMAGIKSQYVEDAVTLAFSKVGEDGELKTVLTEFKTKYPMWFEETEDEKNNDSRTGQRGTGATVKTGEKGSSNEKGYGARLAAQRRTNNNNKTSYWSSNRK